MCFLSFKHRDNYNTIKYLYVGRMQQKSDKFRYRVTADQIETTCCPFLPSPCFKSIDFSTIFVN